jgi:hypothetical protein
MNFSGMKNDRPVKLQLDIIPDRPLNSQETKLLSEFEAEHAIRYYLGELIGLLKSGCGNWKQRFEETCFDLLIAEYGKRGDDCVSYMRKDFMIEMIRVLNSLRDLGVDFLREYERVKKCEEWNYAEWVGFTKSLYVRFDELYSGKVGSSKISFQYVGSPYVRWDFPKRKGEEPSLLPSVSRVLPDFDVESLAVDSRWKITRAMGFRSSRRSEPGDDHYPQVIRHEVFPRLERFFLDSSAVEAEALLRDLKELQRHIGMAGLNDGFFLDQCNVRRYILLSKVRGLRRDRERIFSSIVDLNGDFHDPSEVRHRVENVLSALCVGWRGATVGYPEIESSSDLFEDV